MSFEHYTLTFILLGIVGFIYYAVYEFDKLKPENWFYLNKDKIRIICKHHEPFPLLGRCGKCKQYGTIINVVDYTVSTDVGSIQLSVPLEFFEFNTTEKREIVRFYLQYHGMGITSFEIRINK